MPVSILDDKPELEYWLVEYWEAFWVINRSRTYVGMSGHPLPLSLENIKTFTYFYGIYDIDELIDFVFQMDNVFLEYQNQKVKEEEDKNQ